MVDYNNCGKKDSCEYVTNCEFNYESGIEIGCLIELEKDMVDKNSSGEIVDLTDVSVHRIKVDIDPEKLREVNNLMKKSSLAKVLEKSGRIIGKPKGHLN